MLIKLNESAQSKYRLSSDGSLQFEHWSVPNAITISADIIEKCIDRVDRLIKEALADKTIQEDYGFTPAQLEAVAASKQYKVEAYFGTQLEVDEVVNTLVDNLDDYDVEFNMIAEVIDIHKL